MTIRSLFDPSKDIYRTIEKVITYGASQEGRLKAEISEYVVTESIEEQFRKLLDRMHLSSITHSDQNGSSLSRAQICSAMENVCTSQPS